MTFLTRAGDRLLRRLVKGSDAEAGVCFTSCKYFDEDSMWCCTYCDSVRMGCWAEPPCWEC